MSKIELIASSNPTTNATCIERNLAEKDARTDLNFTDIGR